MPIDARHIATAVLLSFTSIAAANSGSTSAEQNERKLAEIPRRMQAFVDDSTIAGAVTLVAYKGEIRALDAVGWADLEAKKPMRRDTLFWIASMTKPITATAVLMLQDRGKLLVDDPIEKYLPEFKKQWLVDSRTENTLVLKRSPRPVTLRDLLTHTSGLADVPAPRSNCSLAELVIAYSQQPLKFAPGSRWEYCNSGLNTLGRIVEIVSGESYADFLQNHIFRPLGMKDTTFWPTSAQEKRLAKSYQPTPDGKGLEPTNIGFINGNLRDRSRTPFPSGGLFSTAQDMWHFYQMALNGGGANGKRILSRDTLNLMTRTQTGDLPTGFTKGMSFGFGWGVVKDPNGVTQMLSPGTFGHGGAYGTQGWIDPKKDMILVLMIQRAKLPNADASPVRQAFQETAVMTLP